MKIPKFVCPKCGPNHYTYSPAINLDRWGEGVIMVTIACFNNPCLEHVVHEFKYFGTVGQVPSEPKVDQQSMPVVPDNWKATALRDSMTGGVCPQHPKMSVKGTKSGRVKSVVDVTPPKMTKRQKQIMAALDKGGRLHMRNFSGYCYKGRLLHEKTLAALIGTGELIEVRTKSPKGFYADYVYHHLHRPDENVGGMFENRKILSIEHLPKEIR
jgi:hypothetical protein